MSVTYNLINKYFPSELRTVNEPWQYLHTMQGNDAELDRIMNDFIDTVNAELAKAGEAVRLYRLSDITLDMPTLQPRVEMSEETIQRYRNAYENNVDMRPVDVATIKEYKQEITAQDKKFLDLFPECSSMYRPKLYLVHGYHRYKAVERLPLWLQYIAAVDHGEMTLDEAKYFSVRQNTTNGLPFTKADMPNVFRTYVDTGQYKLCSGNVKSYKTIAKELSFMSRTTITKYMKALYPDVDKEIRRQHPCTRPKDEEGDDVNMKRCNSKTVDRFGNKLAELKKITELMNTEYDTERCAGLVLAFAIDMYKKIGADTSALSAMFNAHREF